MDSWTHRQIEDTVSSPEIRVGCRTLSGARRWQQVEISSGGGEEVREGGLLRQAHALAVEGEGRRRGLPGATLPRGIAFDNEAAVHGVVGGEGRDVGLTGWGAAAKGVSGGATGPSARGSGVDSVPVPVPNAGLLAAAEVVGAGTGRGAHRRWVAHIGAEAGAPVHRGRAEGVHRRLDAARPIRNLHFWCPRGGSAVLLRRFERI